MALNVQQSILSELADFIGTPILLDVALVLTVSAAPALSTNVLTRDHQG